MEESLEEFRSSFENDAKKTLADAWEKSTEMGQQSENMTKIAQAARELADKLDDQAELLVTKAKEAKNKSSEVYDLAKKANTNMVSVTSYSQFTVASHPLSHFIRQRSNHTVMTYDTILMIMSSRLS